METVKRIFIKSFLFLLCFQSVSIYAQTPTELQDAFQASYRLEESQDYDKAILELTKWYSDESYEINLRLGWLHYLANDLNKSIDHYKKSIQLMPVATEPLWGIIAPYSKKDDWTRVENCYQSILSIDSKNSLANYRLGLIYYYRKNYTKAIVYFDVVLNLTPFDYDALIMSAWTNYFLGALQKAKILFHKALLNRPHDASALEGLSYIK